MTPNSSRGPISWLRAPAQLCDVDKATERHVRRDGCEPEFGRRVLALGPFESICRAGTDRSRTWAARGEDLSGGSRLEVSAVDDRPKSQTSTASPAEPGELSIHDKDCRRRWYRYHRSWFCGLSFPKGSGCDAHALGKALELGPDDLGGALGGWGCRRQQPSRDTSDTHMYS
jgi:hypothetical protein